MSKTVKLYIPVDTISPDPVQYKPYNPVLSPKNLYVEVELPASLVVLGSELLTSLPTNGVVVTPRGLAEICGQIALGIRDRHERT